MLILSRKKEQDIVLTFEGKAGPQRITLKITEIRGDSVRLGITADKSVTIHRKEVQDEIDGVSAKV